MSRPKRLRKAHAHIFSHGLAMRTLRLEEARSAGDVLSLVQKRAESMAKAGPERWLVGGGIRVDGWAKPEWPARAELDRACPDRACVLWSFDSHALVANSRALEAAGITRDTPDPTNGRIMRDAKGEPTGVMLELAAIKVWEAMPELSLDDRRSCVRDAVADLRKHGFVEIHEMRA